jgi:hypothetical protein
MDALFIPCLVLGIVFLLAAIATFTPKLEVIQRPDGRLEIWCTFRELPAPAHFDYFGHVGEAHHAYTSSTEPGLFVLHESEIPRTINGDIQEHFRTGPTPRL